VDLPNHPAAVRPSLLAVRGLVPSRPAAVHPSLLCVWWPLEFNDTP
jgi:hypothetical protein